MPGPVTPYNAVLVIDSAMSGCGVAVVKADGVHAVRHTAMIRGQAEALMPMVEEVLQETGVEYGALDAVVVTCGPGAFTGLRIGMSAAKSLGLALDIPVFGVTTLQALAFQYVRSGAGEGEFSCLIETKRTDFYCQSFDEQGFAVSEAVAAEGDDLAGMVKSRCIGDAAARFVSEVAGDTEAIQGYEAPDTLSIGQVFLDSDMREVFFVEGPDPVYLRPPDVSLSKKKQRVIGPV